MDAAFGCAARCTGCNTDGQMPLLLCMHGWLVAEARWRFWIQYCRQAVNSVWSTCKQGWWILRQVLPSARHMLWYRLQ